MNRPCFPLSAGLRPPARRWFTSVGATPTVTQEDDDLALGYSESGTQGQARRANSTGVRGEIRRPLLRRAAYGAPLLCAMHATSIRSASLASSMVKAATVSS